MRAGALAAVAIALLASSMTCTAPHVAVELLQCWPDHCAAPDAGVLGGDGGACTPTAERCDGIDNDCNGRIDEGVCTACPCDTWGVAATEARLGGDYRFSSPTVRDRLFEVAFDGAGTIAIAGRDPYGGYVLWFSLRGAQTVDRTLPATDGLRVLDVAWSGTQWVVAWLAIDRTYRLTTVSADGVNTNEGQRFAGSESAALAASGSNLYWAAGGASSTVTRLGALNVTVPLPRLTTVLSRRGTDEGVAVMGLGPPGSTVYLELVRGDLLVAEVDLGQATSGGVAITAAAASDSTRVVPCFKAVEGLWCRTLSLQDATPLGPPTQIDAGIASTWDVAKASCGFAVITGEQFELNAALFRMHQFNDLGTVVSATLDHRWGQPGNELRLFSTAAGRLLRVHAGFDFAINIMVTIADMGCRAPPRPVADCGALVAKACDLSCHACPRPSDSECGLIHGNSDGYSFTPATCPSRMSEILDCGKINAEQCSERLIEPLICVAPPWVIPADCVFPR